MEQQAFTFDKITMQKIAVGFLHSLATTILLGIVNMLMAMIGEVHITDPTVALIFAYICQNVYNIAKEYISGIYPSQE